MQINRKVMALLLALVLLVPAAAFAEDSGTTEPEGSEGDLTETTTTLEDIIGDIPEDSPIYPFRLMLEGTTITVVVDEVLTATLIVHIPNPEMFGEEILPPEVISELEEYIVSRITSDCLSDASSDSGVYTAAAAGVYTSGGVGVYTSGGISTEVPEGTVSIEILLGTGLSAKQIECVLCISAGVVGKTLATESFLSVKDAFFDAKAALINAMNEWKIIRKMGTEEEFIAALEALMEAREYKEEMEKLKDEVEAMKEGIKDILECFEEGMGKGPKEENPSIMNKLESNGIGEGLLKYKGEVMDSDITEADVEAEDNEGSEKTNNGKGKGRNKDKGNKANNGKKK